MFKFLRSKYYNFKQKRINKQYENEGFSDEILDKQIALNIKRSEKNIHDPSEVVYTDSEGNEFVQ